MADVDFAEIILPVAKEFWGDPSSVQGNKVRWGNAGSRVVNTEKGVWKDFESDLGGGVIDLILAEQRLSGHSGAMKWLQEHGYIQGDPKYDRRESAPTQYDDAAISEEKSKPRTKGKFTIVNRYDYKDGDELLYQVRRIQWEMPDGSWRTGKSGKADKTFMQCRPSGHPDGSLVWGLSPGKYMRPEGDGDWKKYDKDDFAKLKNGETIEITGDIPHSLYRRTEIELAGERGQTIYIVEGEKAVDAAVKLGIEATCNSGGANKFHDGLLQSFRGSSVVLLPDNDQAGVDHANFVARKLRGIAASVKVVALPGLPPKGDIVEWVEAGGTKEKLEALVAASPLWQPPLPKSTFGAVQMSEVAGRKVRHDWLVHEIIERHAVFMIAGQSQAGKTFVSIDMGMRIARGEDFAKKATKQGLVIYQCGEDANGVLLRLEGFRQDKGIDPNERIPFVVLTGKLNLSDPESVAAFKNECNAWSDYYEQKIECIFIDTFKKATVGMEEISGKEVGAVIANLESIAKDCNCTVGIVHHMTKDGSKIRGHSSLYDDMQNVLFVTEMRERPKNRFDAPAHIRDENGEKVRKVRLDKIKNGEQRDLFRFVTRKVKVGVDDEGRDVITCVLDNPAKHNAAEREKSERLSDAHMVFMEALRIATEESGEPTPAGVRIGPSIKRVCPQKSFVGVVRRMWTFNASSDDKEARNKELEGALKRNVQALVVKGYIGRDNDKGIIWAIKSHYERKAPPPVDDIDPPDDLPDDVKRAFGIDPDHPPF